MICRHCGAKLSISFLDLGSAPPSNAYLTKELLNKPEKWYPLRIMVCKECWLVQTEDYADRESLFDDNYAYFSSFSTSWLEHAKNYAEYMINRFNLNSDSLVVEIAANDGYLLQYFIKAGIPCFGIEPTASTAEAAIEKGIEIIKEFFGTDLAEALVKQGRQADLIAANNVLAHVPDINDFVSGFAALLKPKGVATFEFPHLLKMVQQNQFDTVYHEHYSYLSLTSVNQIFLKNGLKIFDVQELPTHGGSLRVFAERIDTGNQSVSVNVDTILKQEKESGITDINFYSGFQLKAEQVKDELLNFLIDAKYKGIKIAGYGAAAKGNTLLNFAGVRPDLLSYIVDKNPAKQGKFMPGSRIPVVDETCIINNKPDLVLILPWNIKDEIIKQLSYIREWGGKFITAVPVLKKH